MRIINSFFTFDTFQRMVSCTRIKVIHKIMLSGGNKTQKLVGVNRVSHWSLFPPHLSACLALAVSTERGIISFLSQHISSWLKIPVLLLVFLQRFSLLSLPTCLFSIASNVYAFADRGVHSSSVGLVYGTSFRIMMVMTWSRCSRHICNHPVAQQCVIVLTASIFMQHDEGSISKSCDCSKNIKKGVESNQVKGYHKRQKENVYW